MSTPNSTSTISPSQAEKSRAFSYRYYLGRAEHWKAEADKFAAIGQRACAELCTVRHEMYFDLACEFAPLPQLTRDFAAQLPPWERQAEMQEAHSG